MSETERSINVLEAAPSDDNNNPDHVNVLLRCSMCDSLALFIQKKGVFCHDTVITVSSQPKTFFSDFEFPFLYPSFILHKSSNFLFYSKIILLSCF